MLAKSRGKTSKASAELLQPFKDVEAMAQLMMQEAKASLPEAGRLVGKLIVVSIFGFVLASSCCFSRFLTPIGVIILAIAAGWMDAFGNECSRSRFFPYKTLNSIGATLFRWQWVVVWALVLFLVSCTGTVRFLQFAFLDRLWNVSVMAAVPLALMLFGRALEPYQFRRARADIQRAEMLVRQLAATRTMSDVSAIAPLIEIDQIPLYKLGSVAKALYEIVASYDVADKLTIELTLPDKSGPRGLFRRFVSMVYSPFRMIASDLLLWKSRDIVLYIAMALYVALVYAGSFHSPWASLCIIIPFMGPKSRTGKYLRALQENIRLAQGASAQKKGDMLPAGMYGELMFTLNWPMLVYISSVHAAALYALVVSVILGGVCPLLGQGVVMKWETAILAFALYICAGLGITAGAHRLWAHKSYKAGVPLRLVLMIFNSIANQGTIFHWARDHRVHHLYSDTIADPHDSNRGFWFSHVGWLLFKKHPAVREAGQKVNLNDLRSDPVVMFQKRADPFWNLMWCFGFPSFAALLWGDSLWNGFLLAALRYVVGLNATWAVNSVVHAWGTKPYNASHRTTENGWVALFALGEGWHNWHHAFSWDYATAELGALLQFNPTKIFIDSMAFVGLAWDRKRALEVWSQRKARWEETQGRPVLESVEGPPLFKRRVVTFGPVYDDHHDDTDSGIDATTNPGSGMNTPEHSPSGEQSMNNEGMITTHGRIQ